MPLKIAVDNVIGDEPLPGWLDAIVPESLQGSKTGLLVFVVLFLVVIELITRLTVMAKSMLRIYTSERLTLGIRARLFRHAQRLALHYHDRKGTADANYRIQNDALAVPAVAVDGVMPFVAAGITLVAMVFVIARIDLALAAIALVVAPVLMLLTWSYRRRLRTRYQDVKTLESSALAVVQEALTSMRVVKAFGQEEREERRFERRAGEGMRARIRVMLIDNAFWLAIGLVTAAGAAAVLFVGVRSVESGAITLGSLLLVMVYLSDLYDPLETMSRQIASLQSGFASAERVFALLDEERDVPERARPGAAEAGDRGRLVPQSLLRLRRRATGARERLVRRRAGHAGRDRRPDGGGQDDARQPAHPLLRPDRTVEILLDGVDLRDYRLADLRDQFAIVLQDPVLFSTTIGDNIAYGRPDARLVDIVEAAKAAGVHDFIEGLPERLRHAGGRARA